MSFSVRRLRGLGIALVVLAISAGAAFAATAPTTRPNDHAADQAKTQAAGALPSHPAEQAQGEDEDQAQQGEADESPEATDPAKTGDDPEEAESPDASPDPNTHGALVSTAAHMTTPAGFPNHGAFVSCVAKMDAVLTGFDWTKVTPEACGITTASGKDSHASGKGADHSASGKAKGQAGKAKGQAAKAQHKPAKGH